MLSGTHSTRAARLAPLISSGMLAGHWCAVCSIHGPVNTEPKDCDTSYGLQKCVRVAHMATDCLCMGI